MVIGANGPGLNVVPSAPPLSQMGGADVACIDVSDVFKCPITLNVMFDPVVTKYGHTFERHALVAALSNRKACPLSGQRLFPGEFVPNFAVRGLIEEDAHAGPLARKARAEYDAELASRRPLSLGPRAFSAPGEMVPLPHVGAGFSMPAAAGSENIFVAGPVGGGVQLSGPTLPTPPVGGMMGRFVGAPGTTGQAWDFALNWQVHPDGDVQPSLVNWPFNADIQVPVGGSDIHETFSQSIHRVMSPDRDKYVEYNINGRVQHASIYQSLTHKRIKKIRCLNSVYSASWSACSTKVAITLANHRGFIHDLTNGRELHIKECDGLYPNPVNDTFAVSTYDKRASLEVHHGKALLARFSLSCSRARWSPDGSMLLAQSYIHDFRLIDLKRPVRIAVLPESCHGLDPVDVSWLENCIVIGGDRYLF